MECFAVRTMVRPGKLLVTNILSRIIDYATIPTSGISSGTYTVIATRGTQRTATIVSVVK